MGIYMEMYFDKKKFVTFKVSNSFEFLRFIFDFSYPRPEVNRF